PQMPDLLSGPFCSFGCRPVRSGYHPDPDQCLPGIPPGALPILRRLHKPRELPGVLSGHPDNLSKAPGPSGTAPAWPPDSTSGRFPWLWTVFLLKLSFLPLYVLSDSGFSRLNPSAVPPVFHILWRRSSDPAPLENQTILLPVFLLFFPELPAPGPAC